MPDNLNIDFALLRAQRRHLAEALGEPGADPERLAAFEGILNLLDAIVDEAIESGETTEAEALLGEESEAGWWVEPIGIVGDTTAYGPFADEIEASVHMDDNDLADNDYKIVWRGEDA